jgi:hypothetical protein
VTRRRNSRGVSSVRAVAERKVEDARERRRDEARERDETDDAITCWTFNDPPHALGHRDADERGRRREHRAASRSRNDRHRDAEEQTGEGPPAPAYLGRSAKGEDERSWKLLAGSYSFGFSLWNGSSAHATVVLNSSVRLNERGEIVENAHGPGATSDEQAC